MKIKPEHYEELKAAIQSAVARLGMAAIQDHIKVLKNSPAVKDTEKRLRWDLIYASKLKIGHGLPLYAYMNDVHIDTALKAVMRDINLA
jgi:hypothetical protein